MNIKELRKKLTKKHKPKKEKRLLLSTGSTLLNLQFADNPYGGILAGKCYLFVGDSASGKTALSLTCLAEACLKEEFDDYRLIHDDVEGGALFDITKLFGSKLQERLETRHSSTVEEMYYSIDDDIKKGIPFITVIDSTDALHSEETAKKFQEKKKAHREKKNKKVAGTFGVDKAKMHSNNLGGVMAALRDTNSILILICQTRDNLGFGFEKKTRSGGKALRFYSTIEVWSSIKEKIKAKIRKKDRQIGILSKLQVKKNRITGKEGSVEVPIYYSLGFDDVGSCINYLIDEGHWKKSGGKINAKEFNRKVSLERLIGYIVEKKKQRKLQKIVGKVWKAIDKESQVHRGKRYE